jgi:hypothetical protein
LWHAARTDNASRDAGNNCHWKDGPSHDCTGRNHGATPDRNARKNYGFGPNPNVVSNHNPAITYPLLSNQAVRIVSDMVFSVHVYALTNQNVVSDSNTTSGT